jgi:methylaspartate mutase epsilon subunit
MQVKNSKIDIDSFKKIQEEVLQQWATGKDVSFEEGIKYQKKIPDNKIFSKRLKKAKETGEVLLQPRCGVALVDEHIELLRYLHNEGEADLLSTTIDSYTRQNRYNEADEGIRQSREKNRSMLNGLPVVNYGVDVCKKINESLDAPVQVRHGTPDARLLAEISIAGGFTSYEGGGISYNIPYAKKVSLGKSIFDWQYVDRLIGLYEEAGIRINREPFGPLTGTLVEPAISHSVAIIESILAAEQGVKDITVGYGQCGNQIQDIAAIRTLEILTKEYLDKFGYNDVEITTVLHQWMGGFPQDEVKAFSVISLGAATAAMAGTTKVIVKTPHEAIGIPTKEANAEGLRASRQMISMLADQRMPLTDELKDEMEIIIEETRNIIDYILELGKGDIAQGTIEGFNKGVIDIPFAPSKFNLGKILPARDNRGAVRFLDCGNIPFSKDIKDFHRQKIEERALYEKRKPDFQMVIDDVYAVSAGKIVGRPGN